MTDACCVIKKSSLEATAQPKDGDQQVSKKTILFMPLDCVGHVNSVISVADSLKSLGHRTVFLFFDPMDSGLPERGHEVYDCTSDEIVPSTPTEVSEQKWVGIVNEMGRKWRLSQLENFKHTFLTGLGNMMQDIMRHNERVEHKLKLIKPDFIVVDHYFIQPALIKYGKPWARVFSASPVALHPKASGLPPPHSGFPTNWMEETDPAKLERYNEFASYSREVLLELYRTWNEYLTNDHKLEHTPDDPVAFIYKSPFLNVYMYPKELDYDNVPALDGWTHVDSMLRINSKLPDGGSTGKENAIQTTFDLPPELDGLPGKLIFLSMGSLASGDVELMKRLVAILAKSPHRFIVNRGANWQDYDLAPNMWGQKFLPQLAILNTVDLIITHGGNNTITECFYFGVPGLIVCPIFADQFDNAQRVEELGLGRRLNPFHCSESELLNAIEQVLSDETIRPRMAAIKDRLQSPESKFKAVEVFRDFVERDWTDAQLEQQFAMSKIHDDADDDE